MEQQKRFFAGWMILNPLGFTLGSWLGATTNGLIPLLIPGTIGIILGDLVFGAVIGLAQYLVIQRTKYLLTIMAWWVIASSIGFTLGARIGSNLTYRITQDWVLAGITFGIFMGGSLGIATAFTLFKTTSRAQIVAWLIVSITAWVIGESIAFAFTFSLKAVPLVALAIAAITGLGLIYLRSQISKDA